MALLCFSDIYISTIIITINSNKDEKINSKQ